MKTSPNQFEMMLTFMEENGDLSKPSGNAQGRLKALKDWEQLHTLLNSDGSGEAKSVEKWKKVWSDMKNNTNRKAACIHKAASGTGGGPAMQAKLSDLEIRVLNLIGVQAATGIEEVVEAGFSQEIENSSHLVVLDEGGSTPMTPHVEIPQNSLVQNIEIEIENWNLPSSSQQPHVAPPLTPTMPAQPSTQGTTTPCQSVRRRLSPTMRMSPKKRIRMTTESQRAAQEFLQSDSKWREIEMAKTQKEQEIEKERLRLREMELKLQEQWQQIVCRGLDLIEKFLEDKK